MINIVALSVVIASGSHSNLCVCKQYVPVPKQSKAAKISHRKKTPLLSVPAFATKSMGDVQSGTSQPISTLLRPTTMLGVAEIVSLRTTLPNFLVCDTAFHQGYVAAGEALYSSIQTALEPNMVSSYGETRPQSFVQAPMRFAEPTAIPALDKRVSISLSSTPLETVVGILSKQTGINIVLISKPDQKVSINVKDMPLLDALRHLSALAGVRVLKVRNTMVMAEDSVLKSAYPQEYDTESKPAEVKSGGTTLPASATAAAPEVEPPVKDQEVAKVLVMQYQSAVAMTNVLRDVVQKMGVTILAMPSSLVPALSNIGSGVGAAQGAAQGAQGAAPGADTSSRTIFISGPSKAVAQIEAIIKQTDVARRQVAITVTIHDVAESALKEKGISWVPGQFNVTEATSGSINGGTFQRSGVSFGATMKALETADQARLLSSPNVNVMDGESSNILIGERRLFPIVASFNSAGQPVFSVQEEKIGITLDVSAQISEDGSITLAVRPEVSSIIEFLNVNGGSYPQVATRSSFSKLTMKTGDTMVIGGLVKDEDIKNYERMPLLSNIPFFGELFKSRKIQKRKSQLIISITPTLIAK